MYVLRSLVLFLLFSCQQEIVKSEKVFSLLDSAYKVDIKNYDKSAMAGGVWYNAALIKTYVNNFDQQSYCVNVLAPKAYDKGIIALHKMTTDDCEEHFFDKPIWKKSFFNFELLQKENVFSMIVDREKRVFDFINLKTRIPKKKYANFYNSNKYGGMQFSVGKEVLVKEYQSRAQGEFCFKLDDQCQIVLNTCHKCPYGIYPVKASACKSAFSYKCGEILCGQRGESACVKSNRLYQINDYCINNNPNFYCSNGLSVTCFNEELICQ